MLVIQFRPPACKHVLSTLSYRLPKSKFFFRLINGHIYLDLTLGFGKDTGANLIVHMCVCGYVLFKD